MSDGERPATELFGSSRYLTEILGEKAVEKIQSHQDPAQPLFLYFAPTTPHTPLQVPPSYLSRCENVVTPASATIPDARKLLCGMMTALDDQIGNIKQALDDKGMLEDTLFVYLSDNGGIKIFGSDNSDFNGSRELL